jgi:bifunctional non-homologous end joining protein LigD
MDSINIDGVKVTHPNKVLFLKPVTSKIDIINYYKSVSKVFLKEVKDRPISMVRSPNGIKGPKFYQKHPTESFPEYIERVKIKEKDEFDTYITLDNVNDLVYLVNIGVLEFHIWGSKIDSIESPDRMIFDLDPSKDNVDKLHELVLMIKDILERNGYTPLLKTSGSKGYHIYTDIKKFNYSWSDLKLVSKTIAESIVKINPKDYTVEFHKEKREGRIFIDWLRNERGATMVAPYSIRIKEGVPVSMPIDWSELKKTTPTTYNINNIKLKL